MARNQAFVTTYGGQFYVVINQQRHGPYATQKAAIRAAVDWAHQTGNSQVLVQDRNSQWRAEWTYGNDPYPPPG